MNQRKDYCGPSYMPKCLRRLLSSKFNASCKIHDLDYASKKFKQKEADKRFLAHMLRQAGSSKCCKILAYVYYYAVRIGGAISYK